MAKIGERAELVITREQTFGVFVDAGEPLGEVLLPRREMPVRWEIGGTVGVFLYTDSEDRPVATMKTPKVMPGGFGYLEVVAVTGVGAFLDWGLPKDLLLPFREQKEKLEVGKSYVVHVHNDPESDRIIASRRLARFFDTSPPPYQEKQEVDLLLYGKTDLGYKAIVNDSHSGVLFGNEVFRRLRAGERTKGYVTKIRPDGKIDLTLYPPGRARIDDLEARIEEQLRAKGGYIPLTDSSPPEAIQKAFGVSKKAFKQATGALFRKRKITIGRTGIKLIEE